MNSKGFGGNNASATMLSPAVTTQMLQRRYSRGEWQAWQRANEAVKERQQAYDDGMVAGSIKPIYKFDHGVLGDEDVEFGPDTMSIGGQPVSLDLKSPYDDMNPASD